MFDKLFEAIGLIIKHLNPFVIIQSYEAALLMRFGKKVRIVEPGFHLLPLKLLAIDSVLYHNCKKDTIHIEGISVTTTDDKTIAIEAILEYELTDITLFMLETNDAISNFRDISGGVIADELVDCTWEEVKKKATLTKIKKQLKTPCEEMGLNVKKLYFKKITLSTTYTLIKGDSAGYELI